LDEGIAAAEDAGDRVLLGYLIASRVRIATAEGDHLEVRDTARAAVDVLGDGRGVSGRMLAWCLASEARGCAGMGDLARTERALARAEQVIAEDGRVSPGSEMTFFSELRLKALAGECYVFARQPNLARVHLEETLRLLPASHMKLRAMAEMDLARALVQAGQVSDGRALARQAMGLQDGAFIGPLAQRVHDLKLEIAAIR
jgi:hypothetical protein